MIPLNPSSCICHISSFCGSALNHLQILCGFPCPLPSNWWNVEISPATWHFPSAFTPGGLSLLPNTFLEVIVQPPTTSPDCPDIPLMVQCWVYQTITRIFGKCSFETKAGFSKGFPQFSLSHPSRSVINKGDDCEFGMALPVSHCFLFSVPLTNHLLNILF